MPNSVIVWDLSEEMLGVGEGWLASDRVHRAGDVVTVAGIVFSAGGEARQQIEAGHVELTDGVGLFHQAHAVVEVVFQAAGNGLGQGQGPRQRRCFGPAAGDIGAGRAAHILGLERLWGDRTAATQCCRGQSYGDEGKEAFPAVRFPGHGGCCPKRGDKGLATNVK
jgi:hypothetical protein